MQRRTILAAIAASLPTAAWAQKLLGDTEMHSIRAENRGVFLETQGFGAPENPGVVLIMGATASMLWWPETFCRQLADAGFYVVRFDHRDTGKSTTQPPGRASYSVEDMAADLIAVMDAHNLERAHLVGMSLGGMIAQMTAVARPERVLSLTLVASEPLGGTESPLPGIDAKFISHFETMSEVEWNSVPSVTAFMLETARLSVGRESSFDIAATLERIQAEISRASSIQSAFNHGLVAARADWTGRAREIEQPTLVIHGAEDPILPLANGQAINAILPNAEIRVLDGVGHEIPAPVLEEIKMGLMTKLGTGVKNSTRD